MKKLLITICVSLITINLTVSQIVTIKDKNGNVLNDTKYVHVDDNGVNTTDTVKLKTFLNDTFSVNTDVKVTRFNVERCSTSDNFYCWDICYTPAMSSTPVHTSADGRSMVPGAEDNNFSAYHLSNGETGNATYRFGFSIKGSTDTSFVDVEFQVAGDCGDVGFEEKLLDNLSIHPNPSKNLINVTPKFNGKYDLKIINYVGQEVLIKTNLLNNNQINISNLENGIYFVRVIQNNKTVALEKLIIK